MFGIVPQWTVGVGVIIVLITLSAVVLRLLPPQVGERGRRSAPPDGPGEALGDVQRRLRELDAVQTRLAELEERLDFADRLLAQQRDGERIAPPRS
ncbi:MAG TPA: hypothetical protein VH137_04615 [Gemmatimonadales bacterium]|nr:hypothetical protein [Gemmatimonadales bacterium]